MKKIWLFSALIALLLAGCTAQPSPTSAPAPSATPTPISPAAEPTPVPPTAEPTPIPPAAEATKPAGRPGLPLPVERGELFSTSGTCAACHTNMIDEGGNDVSTDDSWRASMMANASRDPYWQASVRGEVISNPDYQSVIEDKCATCHTPMAHFTAVNAGQEGKLFGGGFLNRAHELHTLALDSVSCNLCHQIRKVGFGEPSTFSGGFVIDTELPAGERLAYGPYPVGKGLARIMQAASGFIPVQGLHIEQSELCATCHTLYTPYLDATGQIAGTFPEQTPYLEWVESDYMDTHSCQDCHMPLAQGRVRLSTTGGPPRSPFFQHTFVGGNAYMLGILNTFGQELQVNASAEQFAEKGTRVAEQLQNHTATLAIPEASLSGPELAVSVTVESQVGHKFPAGFPARRTWLRLTVQDAGGQKVFESGAVNADGSIVGNDNDTDPAASEPHYLQINQPDQVQIYEAIMHNAEGGVTTILLRSARYAKDNRLLPSGFDKRTADDDIAVHGRAADDENFVGGGDRVEFRVDVGDAKGPFTVTVQLLYQSISYRWADNLRRYDSPETARFIGYYETIPNLPLVVANATVEVGN
ncbi:MAG: hypothetical protein JSV36_03700 [Anaerolineae bacterium]|nr:MAG: hypothetical protein JSV36_03700 [Anaerolineae bacterium]